MPPASISFHFPPIKIFTDRHDAALLDADLGEPIAAAEPGAANGNVERLIHGLILIEGAAESFLLSKTDVLSPRREFAWYCALSQSVASLCFKHLRPAPPRARQEPTMGLIN